MKRILLSFLLVFITFSLFSQERKVERDIDKFYYDATDDYYRHLYDSAIVKLEILDFLYEDNSNFKFFLGMCYFFKSDFDKAIIYYEQSLVDVKCINNYQNGIYTPHIVYFYLGFSYEKKGNILDAIKYYDKYIEMEKNKDVIFNVENKIKTTKILHNINN